MKQVAALLLSIVMLLTGLGNVQTQAAAAESVAVEDYEPQYDSLDDEDLLAHIEDLVYRDTVTALDSDEYFVENVSAIYISKEYLDEVAFNSQANIYFGYTLAELDEIFQDTKYIFTLSDDGTTTVQELQEIEDVATETMLKNVAIGTGVILICVTISVVSAGAGAPAISAIFAASATKAATCAVSTAAFGGISAGIVRGIQTGDFNEAMEAAAMGASEGFKWGAISGAIVGGVSKGTALYGEAKKTAFTMNQYAQIQQETGYPVDVIKQFGTMDEYQVFRDAGLKTMEVNGRTALVQNIDLNYTSTLPDGTEVTNLERMQKGYSALDPATGKAYELHHVGQNNNGALAVLTQEQHRGTGNFGILHHIWKDSTVVNSGYEWSKTVSSFWKYLGNFFAQGGA